MKVALEARGCQVVAAIEPVSDDTSDLVQEIHNDVVAEPARSLSVVVMLGGAPARPEIWERPGPFRDVAEIAFGAVRKGTTVYAVSAPADAEHLAGVVERWPAEQPGARARSADSRWQDAAQEAESGAVDALMSRLQRFPELRLASDSKKRTLLHVAAAAGATAIVEALLQNGASIAEEDEDDSTAGDAAFAAGAQGTFELLVAKGCLDSRAESRETGGDAPCAKRQRTNHEGYLRQRLRYEGERLLDEDGLGVMLGWEAPLMLEHAAVLLPEPGGAVLNVGFGLGLVDGYLQDRQPSQHHIIEAHPDVLAEMRRRGWHERPGVEIHAGRWQDVVAGLRPGSLDAIFFDTWQETYVELHAFAQAMVHLLRPGGRFSFFNGLAPYSIYYHSVFCRMAQEDLLELGLTCDFRPLALGRLGASAWLGVAQRYWQFETYYLPLAVFKNRKAEQGDAPQKAPPEAADDALGSAAWRAYPRSPVQVSDRIGAGPCGDGKYFWADVPTSGEPSHTE